MKIFITAKPSAKREEVIQIDKTHFKISVKEPPIDNRANEAVLRALREFLDMPKSRLQIISGYTSKRKIIEIL